MSCKPGIAITLFYFIKTLLITIHREESLAGYLYTKKNYLFLKRFSLFRKASIVLMSLFAGN
jgi:hypothetical protein